jgi:hypothetical protein
VVLSVSDSNVDALFLSLAAAGILDINYTNVALAWVVGPQPPAVHKEKVHVTPIEVTVGDAKYNMDINWKGICHHLETRICFHNLQITVGSCSDQL